MMLNNDLVYVLFLYWFKPILFTLSAHKLVYRNQVNVQNPYMLIYEKWPKIVPAMTLEMTSHTMTVTLYWPKTIVLKSSALTNPHIDTKIISIVLNRSWYIKNNPYWANIDLNMTLRQWPWHCINSKMS